MDAAIAQLILQDRKIAYAITDHDLNVVEVGGVVAIFHGGDKTILGRSLLDLVPELVSSEAVLADILGGELPRFELAWVNRETAEGQTLYLTLVTLPHRDRTGQITGLIHLMQDVTEMGTIDQQLAQSRNELRLLQDRLARQNLELAAAIDRLPTESAILLVAAMSEPDRDQALAMCLGALLPLDGRHRPVFGLAQIQRRVHDVLGDRRRRRRTAAAMLYDDRDRVARVVKGRIADEQGVIAALPRQVLVAEHAPGAFFRRDNPDLAGAGFARDWPL